MRFEEDWKEERSVVAKPPFKVVNLEFLTSKVSIILPDLEIQVFLPL